MKILHLEDDAGDAELVRSVVLEEWPDCVIKVVSSRFTFTGELQLGRYDLILADYSVLAFDGMEALALAKKRVPDTPFIFLSGTIGEDRAIEAVRYGADDYVLKDRMKRLLTTIPRVLRDSEERQRRRQAESRVRELAEMLNQAREAIVITDLEGHIISWNAGAEHLFGWKSDEALGKTTAELFSQDEHAQFRAAREETAAKGSWNGELHVHNRQGNPVVLETRRTLIRDDNGAPRAHLSINSDVTDRKRLEEQFLRAQRMENIGLLAAGIAHDLNNVLAPMLMSAPMLRGWVNDPAGLRMIDLLERSAERGSGLVKQILAFAQGVSSEHRLVQMSAAMREIITVVTGTFPKTIRLEENIAADLWPVKASQIQVHQVLLNLCVNARDAMPEGGTLRLRAENCSLDIDAAREIGSGVAGSFVVLHVEDTGTGIPPNVLERMWEPFFTTKEADKGTGLGLSTVRGIVKSHGGFVEVRTKVGEGTAFRAYFPAVVAAEMPAGPRPPPRAHGELILVVEDSPDIREMTAAMLTRQGYRVLLAADGAEAVTLFNQRGAEIRLVISDLRMPNLDGAMLARVLHRLNPAVKMLVVSGNQPRAPWSTNPWPDNFAADFLPKPFKPDVLLRKVRELIHSKTPSIGAA
ncbi:MAG TPA: response regulator [Opitutaceae bacterium]|nr:response regulator [Opitutaceae bacterium]